MTRDAGARVRHVRQVREGIVRSLAWVMVALGVSVSVSVSVGWAQPAPQNVEVEPVTCWWRTGVSSVRVGEPFTVLLTCSALETEAARAIIDRSRLGPAAVQFPPYEVMGGTQSDDHVSASRRFLQYAYTLRVIAEDAFGRDLPVPEMRVTYRIESQVQQDAALQGREQTYILPPLPMRIVSLVSDQATHIREAAVPTLDEIAARDFRGRLLRLVALILLGVGGLLLALAAVRWARGRRRGPVEATHEFLPHRSVLAAARRELQAVQQQARGDGWTPQAIARALTATRVIASYVAGHPVPQQLVARDAADGEFVIRGGWTGRRRIAVSGAATAGQVVRAREQGRARGGSSAAIDVEHALTHLTAARYGRTAADETTRLDEAVASAIRAVHSVATGHTWLAEAVASLRQAPKTARPRAWAR
jgi:hypothetical protein